MVKTLGGRKLGVKSAHRSAMLRNMMTSLFLHEKIETSIAKAKELRPFAERVIKSAKKGKHSLVRQDIHDKVVYKKLFEVLAPRYAERSGGYTRIIHLAQRATDTSKRGLIALVT